MDLPGCGLTGLGEHTSLQRITLDLDVFGQTYGGQEATAYERPSSPPC